MNNDTFTHIINILVAIEMVSATKIFACNGAIHDDTHTSRSQLLFLFLKLIHPFWDSLMMQPWCQQHNFLTSLWCNATLPFGCTIQPIEKFTNLHHTLFSSQCEMKLIAFSLFYCNLIFYVNNTHFFIHPWWQIKQ